MQDFADNASDSFLPATVDGPDEAMMRLALDEAKKARDLNEVPIGCIISDADGNVIAAAHNRTIIDNDPTSHAEILAIRAAALVIGNYRLNGTSVYTTIEPCAMCAGALVNARVSRLVYGADDERFGAVNTHFGIGQTRSLNHQIDVTSGILADQSRSLMQEFFRQRRQAGKL